MEKNVKSEWWFLANINFVTVGISYFIYFIILLVGNFVEVAILPAVSASIIALIFIFSNFIAVKLAFREAIIEKKELIKYFILNFILFLVMSYKFVPFIGEYIGFVVTSKVLLSLVVAVVMIAVNSLIVINLKD